MKLKTLKDLEYRNNGNIHNEVCAVLLRQEAIKWIKSGEMVEGAKFWAEKFFNLTDEDLK